jgi:putative hydrolase of the HAD superfamily
MTVEVVLFDAGGTLFTERETRDAIYARTLVERGLPVSVERVAELRARLHADMPATVDGHVRYTDRWFREFMRRLLAELGSELDAESLRRDLAGHFSRPENFVVHADAPAALERLLEHGLRLGVVSNWSDRLPPLLEGLGLRRHFEVVIVSAIVGHTKPDRAIFDTALARFGVAAGQSLHVGDDPRNDLAGARRAGLGALLIDRSGGRSGPEVIRSLEELPARVGRGPGSPLPPPPGR